MTRLIVLLPVVFSLLLLGCDLPVLNAPYPVKERAKNILFSSFSERPKTLDPAKAYSSNEYQFIAQIYEPLLQYDYFKRPYVLRPLSLKKMPTTHFLDESFNEVGEESHAVKYTRFEFELRDDLNYQPHPALAEKNGESLYFPLAKTYLKNHKVDTLSSFPITGTRRVLVEDYIYQIKRLADKKIHSPIYGVMRKNIVGFQEFSNHLKEYQTTTVYLKEPWIYPFEMSGVSKIDNTRFNLTIYGKKPEFMYWFAMPFFSPMPYEVIRFYKQPGFRDINLNLDWYPIGSGPFYLSVNNPNQEMRLSKNPYFHQEFFPEPNDEREKKAFVYAIGKPLPLLDEVSYVLEKESIPRWNKFLQGYYDSSGVSADSFDQAFYVNAKSEIELSSSMKGKGIKLYSAIEPTIFYMGFNMLDETVGGLTDKKRKLRQAISIAIDFNEFISIFMNGRGVVAEGPIPPGIDGYKEGKAGLNPYVFQWKHKRVVRRSILDARKLLREAGYPNGINPKTGQALILNYDVPASNSPDDKARLNWYRKQFRKLGINLNIRATQYNRFQEKMRTGNAQLFSWGWHADYPSSENFLFLLNGSNSKVKSGGENAANYNSNEFNQLYKQYQQLMPGDEREKLVSKMVKVVQNDAPWVWGVFPKSFSLTQQWQGPLSVSTIGNNTLKYQYVFPKLRVKSQLKWNQPKLWPIFFLAILFLIFIIPVLISYHRQERQPIGRC